MLKKECQTIRNEGNIEPSKKRNAANVNKQNSLDFFLLDISFFRILSA